jgi:hypothetical protein
MEGVVGFSTRMTALMSALQFSFYYLTRLFPESRAFSMGLKIKTKNFYCSQAVVGPALH